MKSILFAAGALMALTGTASAADMAPRTYTKAPPVTSPMYNWSGFYVGAMGGYSWSDQISTGGVATSSTDIKGGFGGGTIGYNWQTPGSMWLWSLEVDAAGSDVKYRETGFVGFIPVTIEDKIRSFGSVTGRLGVTAGAALFYAKGGYAWADNRVSVSALGLNVSESKVHSGWTVGGGLEYMFLPAWSAKAEYMYADYGSENYNIAGGNSLGLTTHSVKGGINYHFGSGF
jgi:outer membrane immunogenic protein